MFDLRRGLCRNRTYSCSVLRTRTLAFQGWLSSLKSVQTFPIPTLPPGWVSWSVLCDVWLRGLDKEADRQTDKGLRGGGR